MPASTTPAPPAAMPASADLLEVLFNVSMTGLMLLRPVYAAEGPEIVDLAYVQLNAAAQQMLQLPEQPAQSFLTLYPNAKPTGVFDFYCQAFQATEARQYQLNYQHDGLDAYFYLSAQRSGALLVVNFTDTNDQPRTAVEDALRQGQAREWQAHAEVEFQRRQLDNVLMQAPAMICIFDGPQHTFQFVNPLYQALVGERPLLGKPIAVAMPELAGQPIFDLLDQVYRTGETFSATEMLVQLDHGNSGAREATELEKRYYNFIYKARRDLHGAIDGILVFAYEVTPQVQARQQMQQLNEELEMRVTVRSAEARAALFEAEQQREQMRQQEELLGAILGQVPAAVATLSGPQHHFTFFNEAYQALMLNRAVLGRPVAEVLPEVKEQGFIALLDQVYTTGQPFAGTETLMMLHDQATNQPVQRYLNFVYQPLFDKQQQPQGILVFVVDVTEQTRSRKQAEALQAAMLAVAQRRAQERQDLYQIFEQAPVAIVLLREPDHRIDYFNPAFDTLFPREEWTGSLPGHTLAEVYPRIKMAGLVKLLDEVFRTGESQAVLDMPLAELQPGSPRYVTFSYQAYREQGRIVGVAAFVYDTTEQVLAHQAVEANAHQLRLLTDALPVLIGYLDHDYRYRFANHAYQAWFGQSPADLLGQPVRDVVGEAAYQTALPRMQRALAGERVDFDARMDYRPGFFRHIRTSFVPDVQAGEVRGFYSLVTDMTDQVLAREQVQHLNEELATINAEVQATNQELGAANSHLLRTNTDLDTFVYTASHDLKSPITNIEGLLLALREHLPAADQLDPLVAQLLDMMGGAVTRFQQTLTDLTDISRLQQAIEGQPIEEIDLAALVEDVRLDILPEITAAQAILTVDLAACPTVRFSAKNLRSVVYNLLSNAIKYRAASRPLHVALRCHCLPGRVALEVQDNGLGLSETQQGELFQMFRRLHTHVEGSGVGLYMVKKMVENAGGTIAVQSQPDVGSTFTVSLPMLAADWA